MSFEGQARQLVAAVAVFKLTPAQQPGATPPGRAAAAASSPAVVERRSPDRAKNVTRPKFGAKANVPTLIAEAAPARKTGSDDEWMSF